LHPPNEIAASFEETVWQIWVAATCPVNSDPLNRLYPPPRPGGRAGSLGCLRVQVLMGFRIQAGQQQGALVSAGSRDWEPIRSRVVVNRNS
jgi:hypothetical protein